MQKNMKLDLIYTCHLFVNLTQMIQELAVSFQNIVLESHKTQLIMTVSVP